MRHHFAAVLVAVLVLVAAEALAQESMPIVVAGKIVARVRDKGPYESVAQRAAQVNKQITEAISRKEVGVPHMSLKQEKGLWVIYVGSTKLISVYPSEAQANGVTEQELAARWLKSFERELPNCEPMPDRIKRLGAAAFEKPVRTGPSTPAGPSEAGPAGSRGPEPGLTGPVAPVGTVEPPPPSGRSTALLVVIDYFNTVRSLDPAQYEGQKDELGRNLITYLAPFVTAAKEPGSMTPVTPTHIGPATTSAPGGRTPVLVKPAGGPAPGGVVPVKPPPGVATTIVKPGPATAAATSKVPQKQRIRRKMNALQQPLADMKKAGDARAAQIEELINQSRQNYYASEFDSSEELIDAALELAGIKVE